jgi:integrase
MLTDTEIRNAKPKDKPRKLFDGGGLFLLITPTGSKLWRCRYQFEGKEKQASKGAYPQTSLKIAREWRDAIQRDLAEGRDPMAKATNFETVARRSIAEAAPLRCKQYETYSIRRMAEMFAAIGGKPLDEVKPKEIADVLEAIAGRGAPSMADKALTLVNQTYLYAIKKGLCARNPAVTLSVTLPESKPRPAVALEEVPALIKAIDGYGGDAVTKLGLKLMLHTFLRTSEMIGAEWSEFDMAAAVWIVPVARMKMKKGRGDHLVPLSRQALAILEQLRAINGDKRFVFASGRSGKHISDNTLTYALYRCGYHSRMCAHGFRSIASTLLNETYAAGMHSFGPDVIEKQLAHKHDNEVRGVYNRSKYLKPRTEMVQLFSDYLDNIEDILEKLQILGPNSSEK